jgi:ArsR family transcriptional regulator
VTEDSLSITEAEELAGAFKVLSDPVRLRLLSMIASFPDGEVCACDLQAPLERSQATVSHHLSILVNAGLISREQRGKWAWFKVAPGQEDFVRAVLGGLSTVLSR